MRLPVTLLQPYVYEGERVPPPAQPPLDRTPPSSDDDEYDPGRLSRAVDALVESLAGGGAAVTVLPPPAK